MVNQQILEVLLVHDPIAIQILTPHLSPHCGPPCEIRQPHLYEVVCIHLSQPLGLLLLLQSDHVLLKGLDFI
jgi:hypothetical protein